MSTLSRQTTWNTSDTLTASDLNAEFDNIVNDYNGGITNANISGSAAISASKLDLTKPQIKGSYQAITTDVDGATVTFNMASSNVHRVTLQGNRTLAVSNFTAGQGLFLHLIQDGTGSRTVTWWSNIKWPDGTAPTLTTTASAVDSFFIFCHTAGNYWGYVVGQALS